MTTTNSEIEQFRREYRAGEIGPAYSGYVHFAFTLSLGLIVITLCVLEVTAVQPLEWLAIPLTFMYANLSEYFGHRGPMHHPTRGLRLIFRRHTRQHHRFFAHQAMAFEGSRDFKAVLFPPVLIVFFIVVFALPVGGLLAWLFSANVAWLFVATAIGYFLNYELLHFAYHCADDSLIRRVPGIDRLRRLHLQHHDPGLMQRYNFNITYPIGDWLFGTRYPGGPS